MKQLTIETLDNIRMYNENYLVQREKSLSKFLEKFKPIILNNNLIPKNGPIVFSGNHDHFRDQYLVIASCASPIHWMAKKEYFDKVSYLHSCQDLNKKKKGLQKLAIPFLAVGDTIFHLIFKQQIINSGAISVDRHGDAKTSLQTAIELAKRGENIGIFPEGTRKTIDDEEKMLLDFKKGAVIIAKEANAYLQPFAKVGFFEDDKKTPMIKFGHPFKVEKMSVEEATKKLQAEVLKLKIELKEEMKKGNH